MFTKKIMSFFSSQWIIILVDTLLIFFATFFAYSLTSNFPAISKKEDILGGATFIILSLIISLFTKTYLGIIKYTGAQDVLKIAYTLVISSLLSALINYSYFYYLGVSIFPISVNLVVFFISATLLLSYRLLLKLYFIKEKENIKKKKILVFGTCKYAQITHDFITNNPLYKVVGYLDDAPNRVERVINGVKIYDANKVEEIIKNRKVDIVVIPDQTIENKIKNKLEEIVLKTKKEIVYMPPYNKWMKGKLRKGHIETVNIEDLLQPDSINFNNYYISKEVEGKSILITGAAGSIGSEIVKQLVNYNPKELLLFDQSETAMFQLRHELDSLIIESINIQYIIGDITNLERLKYIFNKFKPQFVFHIAAYKHVPIMEFNATEAVLCNILGTKLLAEVSIENQVEKFIFTSTDKAVNPTNVMGASKRIAEIFIQSINSIANKEGYRSTKFITTRFGNVLSSNGSVVPLFKKQILLGGPVTVTHPNIRRYFMTITGACQLVLEAATMGKGGEIFVFDMGRSIKIKTLAERMIKLFGFIPYSEIKIKFTGLRSGEKLYEELFNDKENTINTHHNKIMIAKVINHPFLKINTAVEEVINLAINQNEVDMVQKMKILVPTYISNESKFSKLDNKAVG